MDQPTSFGFRVAFEKIVPYILNKDLEDIRVYDLPRFYQFSEMKFGIDPEIKFSRMINGIEKVADYYRHYHEDLNRDRPIYPNSFVYFPIYSTHGHNELHFLQYQVVQDYGETFVDIDPNVEFMMVTGDSDCVEDPYLSDE